MTENSNTATPDASEGHSNEAPGLTPGLTPGVSPGTPPDIPPVELTVSKKDLLLTDTKEFGKLIHAEALERERKARQDRVIAEVQRLETARLEYSKKAEFCINAADWYAKKLKAIQQGEFDFDLVHGQMLFHDPELERGNY